MSAGSVERLLKKKAGKGGLYVRIHIVLYPELKTDVFLFPLCQAYPGVAYGHFVYYIANMRYPYGGSTPLQE